MKRRTNKVIGALVLVATNGCGNSATESPAPGPTIVLPPVAQAGATSGTAGAGLATGAATGAPTTGSTATATAGPTFAEAMVVDPNAEICIQLDVVVERLIPTVLLLIDKSGSMQESFGTSNRWDVLVGTLVDPTNGVLPRFDGAIDFGVTTYTSNDGNNSGDPCPMLETLDFGTTAQAVADFLPAADALIPDSDTPTGESVQAVTQLLLGAGNGGPRAIILATDGAPDNCAEPDNQGAGPQAESVAAVEAAYAAGIDTYVISVGDQVAQSHLQDLANAGAGVTSGATYYEALNAASLVDAFNEIIYNVTPCDFQLNGTVQPIDVPRGSVVIDGMDIPYDASGGEGWTMPTAGSVTLAGAACELAKSGALIQITFPCGAFMLK